MKSLGSLFNRQSQWTSSQTPSEKRAKSKAKAAPDADRNAAAATGEILDAPPRDGERHIEHKQPKSALKQALQAPYTAEHAAADGARKPKTTVAEANRRWNTGPVPERTGQKVRFAKTHQERIITKGIEELKENFSNTPQNAHKVRLYAAAQKAQLPVVSKNQAMMVWPSGQSYHGAFDQKGLPGPRGTVTLADGREFQSSWQSGKCYRLTGDTQHVTPAQIEKVSSFKTVK